MKGRLNLKGFDFTYLRKGSGMTLVLIPGFHTDTERMMPLFSVFSRYFDVVMPELPGIADNSTLGNYKHTARNYALFVSDMIIKLRLKSYILAGFCYGASILIHVLKNKKIRPKSVFLFEAIYHAKYLHLPVYEKILITILKTLARHGISRYKLVDFILHNKKFLTNYFRIKYRREKNREEVVANQIRLTDTMNTTAYIDMLDDIFSTDFTGAPVSDLESYLFYMQHDPLVNFDKNSAGIRRIFPKSEIVRISYDTHSPPGKINEEAIEKLMEPVKPIFHKFAGSSGRIP